jgi:hypothetical protein
VATIYHRWHAAPVISNMLLRNDGQYWPCVFGGWYETDEIAGRDLAPARRFNVLPMVADSIGPLRHSRRRTGSAGMSIGSTGLGRAKPTDRTWLMPATNPILCSTDEIADYDPPIAADPQYVHIPRLDRMSRQ